VINPRLIRTNQKGITLVELLVVIGMIGVLGVISYPVFSRFMKPYDFRAAAREVMTTAMQARSNAVRDNASWQVVFNSGGNTFSLVDPDGAVVTTHDLSQSYGNGIRLIGSLDTSCGNAAKDWNGTGISQAASLSFTGRGFGGNATVYLVSGTNDVCAAVNTTVTGVIRLRSYDGTTPYADSHWR